MGWTGYEILAPLHADNIVSVVCLTIIAVAALSVIVLGRDAGDVTKR